jgi:hypothetical protein
MSERSVPILPSRALRETLLFSERLGFENRGAEPDADPLRTAASCYLFVDDAEARYGVWARTVVADPLTGGRIMRPEDTDYGMIEFAVVDPSGNLIPVGSSAPDTDPRTP